MIQSLSTSAASDSIFLLILACIGVYSYQLRYRRKETLLILRSVYDQNVAEQLFRENSRLTDRSLYTLLVTSLILTGAYLAWWLGDEGKLNYMDWQQLVIGMVCAGLIFSLRYTALQLLGTIGNASEVTDQVICNLMTIMASMGMISLPFMTFAVFTPESMAEYSQMGAVVILCISLALFLFKGAVVSLRSKRVNFLHLFYYFCALEIMPLVWAYRSLLN